MRPILPRLFSDSRPVRRLCLTGLCVLLAACAGTHKRKPAAPVASTVSPYARNVPVVRYALSLQGTPYRWGKESPEEGFDCSGFVQHVYQRHGVRLPRTAYQMATALPPLDDRYRQPGDLVFFNTTGEPYSHVGIYIGENSFVHSSSAKGEVIVSNMGSPYWLEHFLGIRRPGLWYHGANRP